jgi:outer membrane protein OmpA-like peptidoglycan-associated protein
MTRWRSVAAIVAFAALAGCQTKTQAPPETHNYLVFFRFDSADLSPEARQVVNQAATGVKTFRPSTIAIAGFTDRVGTEAYNQHLSERRIAVVEQALIADGIDPKLFLRIPLGEAEAAIPGTGDRRVEIRLTAPPTS